VTLVFTYGKYGVFGLLLSNLFNDTLSNAVFYGPVRYRRYIVHCGYVRMWRETVVS
jgi:hypothetical protein